MYVKPAVKPQGNQVWPVDLPKNENKKPNKRDFIFRIILSLKTGFLSDQSFLLFYTLWVYSNEIKLKLNWLYEIILL